MVDGVARLLCGHMLNDRRAVAGGAQLILRGLPPHQCRSKHACNFVAEFLPDYLEHFVGRLALRKFPRRANFGAIDQRTAQFLPRAFAASVANIDALVTICLFSCFGLLLSLSVLILDQYIPGEWF
jgi:hypothetical protein